MQAADLKRYIENPDLLDKSSVAQLQQLVQDFPYFQSAHLLLSMASKKWDASIYQQSLKKTAILVPNRSHLFELIHRIENGMELPIQPDKKEESIVVEKNETEDTTQHELNILKAAEISTASVVMAEPEPIEEIQKVKLSPEEVLEKEIGSQVVSSFVEKEILKTNEIHYPKLEKQDAGDFVEWLQLLKKNNGQSYEQIEEQVSSEKTKNKLAKQNREKPDTAEGEKLTSRKEKNKAIIDRIIDTNPGLIRNKEELKFFAPDHKAKESLLENEHLVTETLARIYALQGNVNKAVRAYEILSLKFPQKSAYFATLIQKLKHNQ